MQKAIIFDMTQTLQRFDFARMQKEFRKIIKAIPKARSIPIARFMRAYFKAYDFYQTGKIKNDKQFTEKIFSQLRVRLNKKETANFIHEHKLRRKKFIRLAPRLKETLEELKKRGFKLGMLSNCVQNWASYDWRFLNFKPEKFFAVQVSSQQTHIKKPNMRAYEIVLQKMRLKPQQAIFVGDNYEQDILAPKSMGMKTAWLNKKGEKKKADFAIKELFELTRLKELP